MIRVAAVDDSPQVREFLRDAFGGQNDLELVALGSNGAEALDIVQRHRPDLLVLDLEMPGMGGLDVLKILMRTNPIRVVVYTTHGAKSVAAFQALRLGALELLSKPDNMRDPDLLGAAKLRLLARVRAVAAATFQVAALDPTVAPRTLLPADCPFSAIAIGATSGGTAPLLPLLRALPSSIPAAVFIFPQLNSAMGKGFAEWLNSEVSIRVSAISDKTQVTAGHVYIAPTGNGARVAAGVWTAGTDTSVDPGTGGLDASFSNLAAAYGPKLLAVLLGGIGIDGLEGLASVRRAGGTVLVIDPVTAYTPDLPAAAVRHGLASEVVPFARLGSRVLELCSIRRA